MFQEEVGQGCEWAFVYLAYVFFSSVYCTSRTHTRTHVWVCTECALAQEVNKTKMGLNALELAEKAFI